MNSCERVISVCPHPKSGSAVFVTILFVLVVASTAVFAGESGTDAGPPEGVAKEQPNAQSAAPLGIDTLWFRFDSNLEGWSFLTGADSVQEYYPDFYCQEQWRMIRNTPSFNLTWNSFNGSGAARIYAPFSGYNNNSCSYSWQIKSIVSQVPVEWQGCGRIQARIYKSGGDLMYAMIGYRRTGDNNYNYVGWSNSLVSNGWTTVTLDEPTAGAFANLEGVSIMLGAYSSDAYVYVDYVRAIKAEPDIPVLISPVNSATTSDNLPTFQWTGDGDRYTLQIADNNDFVEPVEYTNIAGTQFTVPDPLPNSEGYSSFNYYWRVRGHYNTGEVGYYSQPFVLHISGPHEVPSEFPTIRAAYNGLQIRSGGIILVAPGTYYGPDNCNIGGFGEKPVDIIGTAGPEKTIIDCQGEYRGFYYDMYAGSGSSLEGLTIRNANGNGDEYGAVSCWSASPHIRNCVFDGGSVKAISCRSGALPTIENCIVRNVNGDGFLIFNAGMPRIINTEISFNSGAGIRLTSAGSADIDSCTIVRNGTGMYFDTKLGGGLVTNISNSIVAFSSVGPAVDIISLDNNVAFNCSDLYGNNGGDWIGDIIGSQFGVNGNISDDPNFCDMAAGDFTLYDSSPCAGGPCARIGAYPVACHANTAPVLTPIGPVSVPEGQLLSFTVSASDSEEDDLSFTAMPIPPGANFQDLGNGTASFSWTPTYDQAGSYQILFTVSDGEFEDSETVTITISEVNRPPVIVSPGNKTIPENVLLTFRVAADDPDGQSVTLSAYGLPSGATFVDSGNGTGGFGWLPAFDQSGMHAVSFVASDGSLADTASIQIGVTNVNRAPVLSAIGAKTVTEGEELSFRVSATDPDNDPLSFSATSLPSSASFIDSGNGRAGFSWTPSMQEAGAYTIDIMVSDGYLSDNELVTIDVIEATVCVVEPDTADLGSTSLSQGLYVKNQGDASQSWSAAVDSDWASLSPASGLVGPGDSDLVTVSVDREQTMEGDHLATVSFTFDIGSATVPVSMYTPVKPLFTADEVGILMNETIRIPLNGLAQASSVNNALQVNSSNPGATFNILLTTEEYNGQSVTVVNISPSAGEFDEFDIIEVIFQPGLQGGSGVPSAISYTGTFMGGADTWPGDCNDDGLVDERDLLPIGLYFGKSGPVRDQSGLAWRRCMAPVMTGSQVWQPAPALYADADGSGTVDAYDICALSQNWAAQVSGVNDGRRPDPTALAGLDLSTAQQLYQAVIECPESEGKEILRDLLAAQAGMTSSGSVPDEFSLFQNRPNPFNPVTTIEFVLPTATHVRLDIYNAAGQIVATLLDKTVSPGRHAVEFDGREQASGVYFYRITTAVGVESRKMLLLK